ncbi:MAG: hypothetical protein WA921_13145 [Ahrensia sp.]
MTDEIKYDHPSDRLLLQEEPVMKPAGPVLSTFEAFLSFFVFLLCCAIMYHIIN